MVAESVGGLFVAVVELGVLFGAVVELKLLLGACSAVAASVSSGLGTALCSELLAPVLLLSSVVVLVGLLEKLIIPIKACSSKVNSPPEPGGCASDGGLGGEVELTCPDVVNPLLALAEAIGVERCIPG